MFGHADSRFQLHQQDAVRCCSKGKTRKTTFKWFWTWLVPKPRCEHFCLPGISSGLFSSRLLASCLPMSFFHIKRGHNEHPASVWWFIFHTSSNKTAVTTAVAVTPITDLIRRSQNPQLTFLMFLSLHAAEMPPPPHPPTHLCRAEESPAPLKSTHNRLSTLVMPGPLPLQPFVFRSFFFKSVFLHFFHTHTHKQQATSVHASSPAHTCPTHAHTEEQLAHAETYARARGLFLLQVWLSVSVNTEHEYMSSVVWHYGIPLKEVKGYRRLHEEKLCTQLQQSKCWKNWYLESCRLITSYKYVLFSNLSACGHIWSCLFEQNVKIHLVSTWVLPPDCLPLPILQRKYGRRCATQSPVIVGREGPASNIQE